MKPRFSQQYLATLFQPGGYEKLAEIAALLCGSDVYDQQATDYGLGAKLFLLVEGLHWFAAANRSGSVTYFESSRADRQRLMLTELQAEAPPGFATHYELGINQWEEPAAMRQLDAWLDSHDQAGHIWLWALALRLQHPAVALLTKRTDVNNALDGTR
jgi:hypothetical protein